MHYLYNDTVQIDGIIDLPQNTGVIVDWFISVKGQSIKVKFDETCVRWINTYDKTLKITKLESLTV